MNRMKKYAAIGAAAMMASGLLALPAQAQMATVTNVCTFQNPAKIALQFDGAVESDAWSVFITQENFSTYFTGNCPSLSGFIQEVIDDNAPTFQMKSGRANALYSFDWTLWTYRLSSTGEVELGLRGVIEMVGDGQYGYGTWIPSPYLQYDVDYFTGETTCGGDCYDDYVWAVAGNTVVKNVSNVSAHVRRSKSGKWIRISVNTDRNQCVLNGSYTDGALCTPLRAYSSDRVVIRRNGKYAGSFKVNASGFGKMWVKEPKGKQTYTVTLLESPMSFAATKTFVR
ncbi:MAG: hypothetical protein F2839_00205 [Actinobacteria bacterium]|uniref:Unannotated protein n=1 Tax=freshwater metagenome TaxID=449393 RepID=A0A6J5YL21_9ZZZZ|nr:hypothetical protein [Actinomycetota bacterium]